MLFDLGERTQLELSGEDRAKFLHGFCTNDIKSLTPGQGCEAFVCNIQGKVLGHVAVFCGTESLWISGVPGQEETLFAHLDRYLINEDVQIHRRSAERGEWYFQGNMTRELRELIVGQAAAQLLDQPNLSHVTVMRGGAEISFRLVDWLGETGCLFSGPRAALSDMMDSLIAAGVPVGDIAHWHALRIEAGFPYYGLDITTENLAQEVGRTEQCISFRKGCYLGQEPIARIDAIGHVNRELRRLTWSGQDVPAAGTPLFDPGQNAPVGNLTSAAVSATSFGKIVALGYVRSKASSPGASLAIETAAGRTLVTLV